jgi:hypothetical protein
MVESGELELRSGVQVTHRHAGATGVSTPVSIPDDGVMLEAGDGALVPFGGGMMLENPGDSYASVLVVVVQRPSYDDPSDIPDSTGVTGQTIGMAFPTFSSDSVILRIERDVVRPGGSDYSTTFKGEEIGVVLQGDARVLCQAGSSWHTSGVLGGNDLVPPDAVPVPAGETLELRVGDAWASSDGSLVWRAGNGEPLVVLRAQAIPVPRPTGEPG